MNGPAVEIDSLGVRYDGRWVLRGLSLQVDAGENVAITGPSGSGKSTVLRCIMGLAAWQEGEIRLFGEAVTGHSIWRLRARMAYVAQEPDLGRGSVREVIERPFAYKANAALRGNLSRTGELMDRFHLPTALLGKRMADLSGGEKQRIALVSAILLDRDVILLDEASSALDKDNKQAVGRYLQDANGLAVLSVSHDAEWAGFSSRVVDFALHGSPGADPREKGMTQIP